MPRRPPPVGLDPHAVPLPNKTCDSPRHRLTWLHIPKCGTSFVHTLWSSHCQAYNCSVQAALRGTDENAFGYEGAAGFPLHDAMTQSCGFINVPTCSPILWNNHAPWDRAWGKTGVVMLRDPFERMLSAFMYCSPIAIDGGGCMRRHRPVDFAHPEREERELLRFMRNPAHLGWESKMLLGVKYSARAQLNTTLRSQAKRILASDFVFIGFTEHWESEIARYHATHGTIRSRPLWCENENTRPGFLRSQASTQADTLRSRLLEVLRRELTPVIEPDIELHEAAKFLKFYRK